MGKWSHILQVKAFSDRKKPTKRECDRLLIDFMSDFTSFISFNNVTYKRFLYRISGSDENIFWHYERVEDNGEHLIKIIVDVYTYPEHNPIDHWLELFIARICNPDSSDWRSTQSRIAEKRFELLPTEQDYQAILTASNNEDQYISLERGFYLLKRFDKIIVPLEKSRNLADEHFRPQQTSFDPAISINFFKAGEQARIESHFESEYCLCGICQSERSRLGLI